MSEFKKGDKVVIAATYEGRDRSALRTGHPDVRHIVSFHAGTYVGENGKACMMVARPRPSPPVPIADLVRECELAATMRDRFRERWAYSDDEQIREEYRNLRAAREAASKPKYKPGQEVWVRGQIGSGGGDRWRIIHRVGTTYDDEGLYAHPDDIRPAEG